ncbi:AAA family ATPase [Gilvimarinus xylanilyticus]|uniref:ATP-binding protein n=1 Tax=Gilvimarinus xylanilyticus TaxID=2944139 RepID=A0A9X2I2C8_9GAMM|nr:ATP-binding protein [Gilvimarinus xylanilyticus]MCP8899528.1 ATP-binding protein [Gilvimarinus xylanilyticus]
MSKGTLTFFCGKMGAGKSTRAKQMAADSHAVLLSEDEWLAALYPGQIASLADYVRMSGRLKGQVTTLVQSMLLAGVDVILDFPANTRAQRQWFRDIFTEVGAEHRLVYLEQTDDICLQRIRKRRRTEPGREQTDTPDMFAQVSHYFEPPGAEEGFNIAR